MANAAIHGETSIHEKSWIQGIGSDEAPAPQARLMSVVINGILNRRLPWGLVLLGVFLVVAVELLGVRSLSFAVGSYLSIGTTAALQLDAAEAAGFGRLGVCIAKTHLSISSDPKLKGAPTGWKLPVREVLFRMERNGVMLDAALLAAQSRELGAKAP